MTRPKLTKRQTVILNGRWAVAVSGLLLRKLISGTLAPLMKIKHPGLMIVVAAASAFAAHALEQTAYRHTVESAVSAAALIVAGRMVYRNIQTGQYRFRG